MKPLRAAGALVALRRWVRAREGEAEALVTEDKINYCCREGWRLLVRGSVGW